jgi:alcohol dehydrogenase
VCERQRQPGFTHWGSWAELVAVDWADVNLVAVPGAIDAATAASLGCRFATAWRALVQVGRVTAGEWVLVAGAGGVGLSAVMIAAAAGARVVALDRDPAALELAARVGAEAVTADAGELADLTGGGVQLSVDAIGSEAVLAACLGALRRRGRHVQVGLMPDPPQVPIGLLVARELELLGSHGMAAHHYPALLDQVVAGRLRPQDLITRRVGLDAAPAALMALGDGSPGGVTIIEPGRGGDRTAAPAPSPG